MIVEEEEEEVEKEEEKFKTIWITWFLQFFFFFIRLRFQHSFLILWFFSLLALDGGDNFVVVAYSNKADMQYQIYSMKFRYRQPFAVCMIRSTWRLLNDQDFFRGSSSSSPILNKFAVIFCIHMLFLVNFYPKF